MDSKMGMAAVYGEPWQVDGDMVLDVTGDHLSTPMRDAHRIVAAVNACAGMDDPQIEIVRLRERVVELKARMQSQERTIEAANTALRAAEARAEALRMNYLGCLNLLAECSVYLTRDEGDDLRDSMERALDDAIELGLPIRWKRVLDRIDVEVVPKDAARESAEGEPNASR